MQLSGVHYKINIYLELYHRKFTLHEYQMSMRGIKYSLSMKSGTGLRIQSFHQYLWKTGSFQTPLGSKGASLGAICSCNSEKSPLFGKSVPINGLSGSLNWIWWFLCDSTSHISLLPLLLGLRSHCNAKEFPFLEVSKYFLINSRIHLQHKKWPFSRHFLQVRQVSFCMMA